MLKIINSKIFAVFSAVLLFAVPISAQTENVQSDFSYEYAPFDRSLLPVGETLNYQAFIFGQLIPIGQAQLKIDKIEKDGKPYYLFTGKVVGGYLIFEIKLDLESYIHYDTLRPDYFIHTQSGFEQRTRKLVFDWNKGDIIYYKQDSPDTYSERARTPILPHTRDILSTLYFARDIPSEINSTKMMRLIEKRKVWTVKITVTDEKEITLPDNRKFQALLVKIDPIEEIKEPNEMFRGLFGLEGNITLWVSKEHKIPLMIEGDYTMGFIKLHIMVFLKSWSPENIIG